jgi:hypothetical protein
MTLAAAARPVLRALPPPLQKVANLANPEVAIWEIEYWRILLGIIIGARH